MKEIIKQLERERDSIELKMIRLNGVISDLKKIDNEIPKEPQKNSKSIPKILKTKKLQKVTKSNKKKVSIEPIKQTRNRQITPEIKEFIKSVAGEKGNKEISKEAKDKFGIDISPDAIKDYKKRNGIVGIGTGHGRIKKQKESKKDEELTEEELTELEDTDYIKEKKKKEEVEIKDVSQEIQNYVSRSKITVAEKLRDNIIEKFEKDISMTKIRKMMEQRTGLRTPLKKIKEIGQIHYDIDGNYACNQSVNARIEKLTKDKKKVTCMNCKKEVKDLYPDDGDSDEDSDYKLFKEEF